MNVRVATMQDEPALREIYRILDTYHVEALPWLFRPADDPAAERHIRRTLEGPNSAILVAEQDGTPAGFVAVHLVQIDESDPIYVVRRLAYIDDMAVVERFRRRGIGEGLLHAAEEWARSQGAEALELTVFEFNAGARALYEASGFNTLSRRMQKPL